MNGYFPEKRSTLPPVAIGVSETSSSAGPLPGSCSSSSGFLRICFFFLADLDPDADPPLPESLIYLRYFSQK